MISEKSRLTIWSFEETSLDAAYLCNVCEKRIVNIRVMEEKLGCIKSEIQDRLSNLHQKSAIRIG